MALGTAILATDETGSWERKTAYGSPMSMGDVSNAWVTSSFSWANPAIGAGTTVYWRIYYQDLTGNECATDIMSFTIRAPQVDTEPPQFFDPSASSNGAGQPAQFSLRWTDNVSPAGYIFTERLPRPRQDYCAFRLYQATGGYNPLRRCWRAAAWRALYAAFGD